jgi:hypothetical protein
VQSVAKRLGSAIAGITLQGNVLWFVQSFSGTPAVVKKGLGSTDPASLVTAVPQTLQLAADAGALYLASPSSVAIAKVSIPGGELSTLVTDTKGAAAVTLGPGGIYYATQDGRVLHSVK